MNIRVNYIYSGQQPSAESFWASPVGVAMATGYQQADDIIRARTALGYVVNNLVTPLSAARQMKNWEELGVNTPNVLVFSIAEQNLVVGVLKDITAANVRDIITKIVLMADATESDRMNTDGGRLEAERLDFPDSFFPFGIFKGPGWEGFNFKKWLWLAAAAFAGIETVRSRRAVAKVAWGGAAAFCGYKFVKDGGFK